MTKRTVFGITKTHEQARGLVEELNDKQFSRANISILFPDEATRAASKLDDRARVYDTVQTETRAPEGAAVGASAGSAIGGTLGLLAGLGALAIPGLGPFIAAGPIFAALSGLSVGAAVGGIAGGLIGFGIPEHHARKYANLVQDGAILVAAHCDSSADLRRAAAIFARAGATDIVSSVEETPPRPEREATPIMAASRR